MTAHFNYGLLEIELAELSAVYFWILFTSQGMRSPEIVASAAGTTLVEMMQRLDLYARTL